MLNKVHHQHSAMMARLEVPIRFQNRAIPVPAFRVGQREIFLPSFLEHLLLHMFRKSSIKKLVIY